MTAITRRGVLSGAGAAVAVASVPLAVQAATLLPDEEAKRKKRLALIKQLRADFLRIEKRIDALQERLNKWGEAS